MNKIPLFEGYDEKEVLVTPKQQIENFCKNHNLKLDNLPDSGILSAMSPLRVESQLLNCGWKISNEIRISPATQDFPVKILGKDGKKIFLAYGGGIGPSALCDKMEILIALGAKKFYIIGMCGGIADVNIGDIIVATKAIRDEGLSYHYLEKTIEVKASESLLGNLKKMEGAKFGAVWTSDTMYREVISKYNKYKKHGVLGIDMETASAYAVCIYRNVEVVSLLIVSDICSPTEWNPQFHSDIIEHSICKIIQAIL
jgi:uridine phosphorylase